MILEKRVIWFALLLQPNRYLKFFVSWFLKLSGILDRIKIRQIELEPGQGPKAERRKQTGRYMGLRLSGEKIGCVELWWPVPNICASEWYRIPNILYHAKEWIYQKWKNTSLYGKYKNPYLAFRSLSGLWSAFVNRFQANMGIPRMKKTKKGKESQINPWYSDEIGLQVIHGA